mgnify:CR=1 FL=1
MLNPAARPRTIGCLAAFVLKGGVAGRMDPAGRFVRKSCMKSISFFTCLRIHGKCDDFMWEM